jgi:hypothetical protein
MENLNRYNDIMARVDAWAENHEGYDCRGEAEAEVYFVLGNEEYADWTDDRIAEAAINAWLIAE